MTSDTKDSAVLRTIPKVDDVLRDPLLLEAFAEAPRWACLDAVRLELDSLRKSLKSSLGRKTPSRVPDRSEIAAGVKRRLVRILEGNLRRVVNGSGIIVHTNLGRAILSPEAVDRLARAAACYTNLEFDLESGARGSRHSHLTDILRRLTGAEDALVVNNNAAAVLLALNTLARGREAVVSRGELVEIGGSFRIPDVMARSGAIMREVGTTNRTHLKDYARAIGPETAILLKVHTSNYKVVGFTHQVPLQELVGLARDRGLPVVEDLGSGCLVDLEPYGLGREPLVTGSVEAGVDVVTFSGDKLLGGPQAGIILGRRDLVRRMAENPLQRALRIDKFTVAALEATLRLYLEGPQAMEKIPVLAMIAAPQSELAKRARAWAKVLRRSAPDHLSIEVEPVDSQVGGGSLPGRDLPSAALVLRSASMGANDLEEALRSWRPPVVGRIAADRLLLDVRTLLDEDLEVLTAAIGNLTP